MEQIETEKNSSLSLDEYIRKKKMQDQFCLLNHRKREKDISEEELNMDLDAYIRESGIEERPTAHQQNKKSSGSSKFDRKSIRGEDSDDEEEEATTKINFLDEDVDMDGKYKTLDTINEEKDESLDGMFNFTTVETKQGIRVPSQQWRMLPENLVNRPKGVKRLEFLPLNDEQRYKHVRKGKVNKRNRSRTSSFSSNSSDITVGSFIEKGKFTYKFGDRNRDRKTEGVIGIERAKRFDTPQPSVAIEAPSSNLVTNASSAPAAININMNWDGFFNGFNQAVAQTQKLPTTPVPTETPSSQLASATERLLALLQNQRDQTQSTKYNIDIQKEITGIQGRKPIVYEDRGHGSSDDMGSSGSGVFGYNNQHHSTSMPMNIRFA